MTNKEDRTSKLCQLLTLVFTVSMIRPSKASQDYPDYFSPDASNFSPFAYAGSDPLNNESIQKYLRETQVYSNSHQGQLLQAVPKGCNITESFTSVLNSGKFINNLGFYDTCNKQEGYRYFMGVMLQIGALKSFQLGLCLRDYCDYKVLTKQAQEASNDFFAGIQPPTPIRPQVLIFPVNNVSFKWGAYIFFAIIVVLTLLAIIGTFLTYKRNVGILRHERYQESILNQVRLTKGNNEQQETLQENKELNNEPGRQDNTVLPSNPQHRTTLGNSPKLPSKFWAVFDIVGNFKSVTETRRINSSVQVFELLRVFAMIWIIWAHEYVVRLPASLNYTDGSLFGDMSKSWVITLVESGYYAVDIFLFIGGYVNVLANTKFLKNFMGGGLWRYPLVYVYTILKRYFRIMPSYGLMLLFYYQVVPGLLSGPMSNNFPVCNSTNFWESFVLGWKSGFQDNSLCAGWCWYLAVDFQLFLSVPFLCWVFIWSKKFAIYLCYFLIALTTGLTIGLGFKNDVYWMNYDNNKSLSYYYSIFYMRGNVYFIGALVAMFTMPSGRKRPHHPHKEEPKKEVAEHKTVEEIKQANTEANNESNNQQEQTQKEVQNPLDEEQGDKKGLNQKLISYKDKLAEKNISRAKDQARQSRKNIRSFMTGFLSFLFMFGETVILHYQFQFGLGAKTQSQAYSLLFMTFGKIFFVMGLMGVMLTIAANWRAFTLFIAKNRAVQLVGNVSFTMYLFHFTVIMIRTFSLNSLPTYSTYDMFVTVVADFFFTLILGVASALLLELPSQSLWKLYVETGFLLTFKVDQEAIKRKREQRQHKKEEIDAELHPENKSNAGN